MPVSFRREDRKSITRRVQALPRRRRAARLPPAAARPISDPGQPEATGPTAPPSAAALRHRSPPRPGPALQPRRPGGSGVPELTRCRSCRGCRGTRVPSGAAAPRAAPPAPLARPWPEAEPAPRGRRKERAGRSLGRAGALQGRAPRTRRAPGNQRCGRSRAPGDPR